MSRLTPTIYPTVSHFNIIKQDIVVILKSLNVMLKWGWEHWIETKCLFSSFISQGHTVDTNSAFLTQALRKLGVSVQRIAVIPDIQEVIAKEVSLLSPQYTHLITSGGIGPTHDDVTFESIAIAFQEELYLHPELSQLVKQFFGAVDKNSATMKLAMVPRSAKLNYGTDPQTGQPLRYPLVSECSTEQEELCRVKSMMNVVKEN